MHRKRRFSQPPNVGNGTEAGPSEAKLRCIRIERPIENSITHRQPLREVLMNLNNLRKDNILCDWVLKSNDDEEISVHAIILAYSSPYYQKLFREKKKRVITLQIPATVLHEIVDFIYTGKFTLGLNQENFPHILIAAHDYHFLTVVQACYDFIVIQLRPENCISIFQFTKEYFKEDLSYNLVKYICHNFREVLLQNRDIFELTIEEMVMILSSDELNIANERSLFLFAIKWLEQDINKREQNVLNLFKCLRFGLMDHRFLVCTVMNHYFVVKHRPVLEYLNGCMRIFLRVNPKDPIGKQRYSNDIIFMFGGWTGFSEHNNSFIEVFDKCASRWYPVKNIDSPCDRPNYYHGVCELLNLVYLVGGCCEQDRWNTSSRVKCFDPVKKSWEEKACMHHPRSSMCVVALDGLMYAIGGQSRLEVLNTAESYNPLTNQWTEIASICDARSEASATTLHGKIYVAGGTDSEDVVHQSVEVYDPATNQWTFIISMSRPRYGHCLVSYEGALYAVGGSDGIEHTETVERYEPVNAPNWVFVSSMISSRKEFATVVLDGKIYVMGGSDDFNWDILGGSSIDSTECYDIASGLWSEGPPLYQKRSGMVACLVSGLQNAKEYSYSTFCAREEEEAMQMDIAADSAV